MIWAFHCDGFMRTQGYAFISRSPHPFLSCSCPFPKCMLLRRWCIDTLSKPGLELACTGLSKSIVRFSQEFGGWFCKPLKVSILGVFAPWKLTNDTDHGLLPVFPQSQLTCAGIFHSYPQASAPAGSPLLSLKPHPVLGARLHVVHIGVLLVPKSRQE